VRDQIIELCIQRGLSNDCPSTEIKTWRIKPAVTIHPGAQAVHGIKQEDLDACPAFGELADEIAAAFATADVIVGYNITFDIDMLQAEYARIGRPLLDFTPKKIVDAFRLWQQCEPRSLQHAHQRRRQRSKRRTRPTCRYGPRARRYAARVRARWSGDRADRHQADRCRRSRGVGRPSRHLRWKEVVVFGQEARQHAHPRARSRA
jgi:hypothetical protein